MYKILLLKNERNDATEYYIYIIKEALELMNFSVEIVDNLSSIQAQDQIITITPRAFVFTFFKFPKSKIIHWFQGIAPEELFYLERNTLLKKHLRVIYLSIIERLILQYSCFNFFVSNFMYEHYRKKYKYNKSNYFIMPCFNQELDKTAFQIQKYSEPNFLYVGSLSDWQCIGETLRIFKSVQTIIPKAKMSIFTSELEKAKNLVTENNMINVTIKYVPYSELNKEICNFKYGFIIREKILLNQVATPTKMNGYLANGIIPIYSNVVEDFKQNLQSEYLLAVENVDDAVNKILEFEKLELYSNSILDSYKHIFATYYNRNNYIKNIIEKIRIYLDN